MSDTEKLLADLAAVWVERWRRYGGSLIVDANCDKVQIGMSMDWNRRPIGPESWRPMQRHWHDGWFVGRWRELGELVTHVPRLREAIIHHVALHGDARIDGSRVMYSNEMLTTAA